MIWIIIIGAVIACLFVLASMGKPKFWSLASAHPEEAYLFMNSSNFFHIDTEGSGRPQSGKWEGPYLFNMPSHGRTYKIYLKTPGFEAEQNRFVANMMAHGSSSTSSGVRPQTEKLQESAHDNKSSTSLLNTQPDGGIKKTGTLLEEILARGRLCRMRNEYQDSLKWFHQAAAMGSTEAMRSLGVLYSGASRELGLKNIDEAIKWKRLAAEHGDTDSAYSLGDMYKKGTEVPKNIDESMKWFLVAASQGHEDAQCELGELYQHGLECTQDGEAALKWFMMAAKQGNSSAQCSLGELYQRGLGVPQNHEGAAMWYRLSARQVNLKAMHSLGQLFEGGLGATPDYQRAVKWYWLAAEWGHDDACLKLAEMYEQGLKTAKDNEAALMWLLRGNRLTKKNVTIEQEERLLEASGRYQVAAELGDAYAQRKYAVLGLYADRFDGDEDDYINWCRLAANQGDAYAQYLLGWIFQYCRIGPEHSNDLVEAAKWYGVAAEQGQAGAQFRLACLYRDGEGVPQSEEMSSKWFREAEERGAVMW